MASEKRKASIKRWNNSPEHREATRRWEKNNPEKLRVKRKRNKRVWYLKPGRKESLQLKHWKRRGVKNQDGSQFTWSDYNRLFAQQDGKCAICDKHQSESKHAFCADHNHTTHYVRGLLCKNCNCRLAMFENKDFRERCELYLSFRWEVSQWPG